MDWGDIFSIESLGGGATYIVLPLTVEPSKRCLCHDTRYLNLWMRDNPFSLDTLNDLSHYVRKVSFQTVLDESLGTVISF